MNAGEFVEIMCITLVFLLDVALLRWITTREAPQGPPRLVREYLFYRQHKISRLFPTLP